MSFTNTLTNRFCKNVFRNFFGKALRMHLAILMTYNELMFDASFITIKNLILRCTPFHYLILKFELCNLLYFLPLLQTSCVFYICIKSNTFLFNDHRKECNISAILKWLWCVLCGPPTFVWTSCYLAWCRKWFPVMLT